MESRPAPLDAHPAPPPTRPPRAVLFDRDGTLVHDVPYNRDPALVRALPGARALLDALRERGVRCAVVSNQSGVARGLITPDELAAVNARVEELLGPFDAFLHCPHGPQDGCPCRKPAPGMLLEACRRLDVAPADALMVGDIGADMEAAAAAGVPAVMVPTTVTLRQEVDAAPLVAGSLDDLAGWLLAPPAHAAAGTTAEPAPMPAAGPTAGPAA